MRLCSGSFFTFMLAMCLTLQTGCKSRDSTSAIKDSKAGPDGKSANSASNSFETIARGEKATFDKGYEDLANVMRARAGAGMPPLRFTHAKNLACLPAYFNVSDKLPADLKVGIFKESRAIKTWVRFSSFSPMPSLDTAPDNRGMALKLMGITGPKLEAGGEQGDTVDLVLTSDISFSFRDPKTALEFLTLDPAKIPDWFAAHPYEGGMSQRNAGSGVVGDVYEAVYGTMSPYLFGQNNAAKFHAEPCSDKKTAVGTDPEYLTVKLRENLDNGVDGCFNIYAQLFSNQTDTPVEDPTIDWVPPTSKKIKVAQLVIPAQSSSKIEENMELCENLNFSPWRTIADHRPLGGMNRLRKEVYGRLATMRQGRKGTTKVEPKIADFPLKK